ncbi:relaxase/mobilization nuclease domain-containing protein [Tepidibacter hydrothermalis]|uniref:Relaxase/mobilization nuclease domain-containing protein n=1 Tax=Tepidibacter hydrothermalis TaxID=3036126 RepID=A0ABY8ED31_9FIRM|nr:relaxase/mobilization nuclease domain-containing protein [Tepidibacter hydrothermalis]WFD10848.1 relaxase/mobilization nuclease domain-containing protein [Tepidibacter hydrothermalis]
MAVIEFINGENKTYGAMKKVIDYITNPAKTEPHLIDGHNCDINNAYHQFVLTKRNYNKETGRQYIHVTQSFAPYDKVTPEEVKKIAYELLQMEFFKGFEVVYAVHTDKNHLHTHFVVNTVNAETGLKWKQSAEQLQLLKDYSDDLCRKRGLIITYGKKGNHKNRGEYRTKDKGQSWKYELYLAVKKVKWCSKSKEDFISNMEKLGYKVDWSDERKYITFTTPSGKKCRNRKLYPPEKFTKEALLKAFDLNNQRAKDKELKKRIDLILSLVYMIQSNPDYDKTKKYPLSTLEGVALKDEIAELKKGKGLDWDKESAREM